MASFAREVARRVYAQELRDSDLSFRENEDQYAPLYLITPTGARCNRVLVVGTLTEKDNLGDDVEYWRGRVADPTGSIFVYAGQYQPDAAQALAGTEPPAFVAIVGKPSVYETEDGTRLISIRAESVQRVDAETRDRWVLESAARTLDRLEAFKAFLGMGAADAFSSGDELLKKPPAPGDVADIGKAHLHYSPDLERYRHMVAKALESLKGEISEPKVEAAEPKAGKQKAESERTGPAWEEDEDFGIGPVEREEEIRGLEDTEGPLSFDEDEGPGDAERIEEEEVFFGGREKASPKKRKER
jgi:RPA family protein